MTLDALTARYIRRHWEGKGGRLVWIDPSGVVKDLGAFSAAEIEGVASAVDIARRTSPLHSERARLSAYSYAAERMRAGVRRALK